MMQKRVRKNVEAYTKQLFKLTHDDVLMVCKAKQSISLLNNNLHIYIITWTVALESISNSK